MTTEQAKSRGRGRYGEMRLAKLVHGIVVGRSKAIILPNGKAIKVDQTHPCDVIDGKGFGAYECKWFKELPKFITKVMTQAVRNCPDGMIPFASLCDRTSHDKFIVMREQDFLDLHIGDGDA